MFIALAPEVVKKDSKIIFFFISQIGDILCTKTDECTVKLIYPSQNCFMIAQSFCQVLRPFVNALQYHYCYPSFRIQNRITLIWRKFLKEVSKVGRNCFSHKWDSTSSVWIESWKEGFKFWPFYVNYGKNNQKNMT